VSTFKNRYKNKWLCCLLDVSWELYWLPLMEKTVPRKSLSVELKSQGLTPGLTSLFHSPPRLAVLMHMGEKLQLTSSVPQELIEAIREAVVYLAHTHDGARVAMHCLWHGTPKVSVRAVSRLQSGFDEPLTLSW
jgi:hypothetical protein